MLTGIITNYLTQHRRLVVPQLGTFVVKVPEGGVVFSELLKRDDGILRGLLVQQGGMNDLEAAGAIDRFVFEVRHALEHEGAYAIEGFGRLTLSPGGAIVFQAVLATPVAAAGPVVGESAPEEGNKISSAAGSSSRFRRCVCGVRCTPCAIPFRSEGFSCNRRRYFRTSDFRFCQAQTRTLCKGIAIRQTA